MSSQSEPDSPEVTTDHKGRLWKPKKGATSTAEEFLAAKASFMELHEESDWNPWVLEDNAEALERAERIMGEWTRAEPGFRRLTKKQWEAREARFKAEAEARRAADIERYERDRQRYDAEREHARLSLIERQSRLEYELGELSAFRDGTRFPAMSADKRAEQVKEHEAAIVRLQTGIERLSNIVGDPEEVVDERGWLPRDRREISLLYYRIRRQSEVEGLRKELPELEAELKATVGRSERSAVRGKLESARSRLGKLLAVPRLSAEQMCSECSKPFSSHGWCTPPWDGPCPAWPGWAARIEEARKILISARESAANRATALPQAKPQPLAVIPSGLPIAEVLERLKELQQQFPNAQVRRGRANRWELWPPAQEPS